MENIFSKGLDRFVRGFVANTTPYMDWVGELKKPAVLKADVIAGITVALVLIPQSMAYAQLAELPPYYGLYASFLPVMVAALFGSSRQLATGPVAVVSLLTASALMPLAAGNPDLYLAYAVTLALIIGLIQLVLGIVRLGMMIAFLSHPVVLGFTNAAAIIIASSQLGKIFGVSAETAEHQYETVWRVILAASENLHWPTLGFAALSLAIMLLLRHYWPRLPNVLIAVAASILLSWYFGFGNAGGQVVGAIPRGLPSFEMPNLSVAALAQLSGVALAIALIGFAEAISIAKAMAAQTRQRLDADQELIGQGLGNVTASFFQGYAVSGSFSRSAVNFSAHAATGFSSIVTGCSVGLTLLLLTPLLYHLPQPTLAAVIIMAVGGLIKIKPFIHAWKAQKHDGIVALITFGLTLFYAPHLESGILAGVLLSLGLYIYRTMHPNIYLLARHEDGSLRDAGKYILKLCPKISIIRFEGPLFFANTSYFENQVLERVAANPDLKFIIIDADAINEIDATGEAMLRQLSETLVNLDIQLLFTRMQMDVMDTFKRTGFVNPDWQNLFFRTRNEAFDYVWKHLREKGDFDCSVEDCSARDLSGCVLRRYRRTPSDLLKTIYGNLTPAKNSPKQ